MKIQFRMAKGKEMNRKQDSISGMETTAKNENREQPAALQTPHHIPL